MGMVQNSINQLFATAGIAAKLSPASEAMGLKRDIKNLQQKDTILEEAKKSALQKVKLPDNIDDADPDLTEDQRKAVNESIRKQNDIEGAYDNTLIGLGKNLVGKQSRLLELKPSQGTAESLINNQAVLKNLQNKVLAQIQQGSEFEEFHKNLRFPNGQQVNDDVAWLAYQQEKNRRDK